MKVVRSLLLILTCMVVLGPVAITQQGDSPTNNPLINLLQSKGILSSGEAAALRQASSLDEANQRLAQLLIDKGLISEQEYRTTFTNPAPATNENSTSPVGQFVLPPIHLDRGFSKTGRFRIPPAQSDLVPLVPVLVVEMNSLRQSLLRTFQENFRSRVRIRTATIALAKTLIGEAPSDAEVVRRSAERHVDADTPPVFAVHAFDDPAVPVENTVHFVNAMRMAKRPVEAHLLQEGGHAFGVGYPKSPSAFWPELFISWLNRLV